LASPEGCLGEMFSSVILRNPNEFGRRRISEILRFAQNDKKRRAQNDKKRRAQNDNWMLLNSLCLMDLADKLDFAATAVILGK
jgi:hypothetical protein